MDELKRTVPALGGAGSGCHVRPALVVRYSSVDSGDLLEVEMSISQPLFLSAKDTDDT